MFWKAVKAARIWKDPAKIKPGDALPDRKPRRRGGNATKRGLSHQQVAVLVAADRGGTTVSAVLPAVTIAAITAVLGPVLEKAVLLVTDKATLYPKCAEILGVSHKHLLPAGGEHVRGEFAYSNRK